MNHESRAEITITNKFGNTLVYSGFVMGEPLVQQDGVYFRVFCPNKHGEIVYDERNTYEKQ